MLQREPGMENKGESRGDRDKDKSQVAEEARDQPMKLLST